MGTTQEDCKEGNCRTLAFKRHLQEMRMTFSGLHHRKRWSNSAIPKSMHPYHFCAISNRVLHRLPLQFNVASNQHLSDNVNVTSIQPCTVTVEQICFGSCA